MAGLFLLPGAKFRRRHFPGLGQPGSRFDQLGLMARVDGGDPGEGRDPVPQVAHITLGVGVHPAPLRNFTLRTAILG
jgi:hypothetical protein